MAKKDSGVKVLGNDPGGHILLVSDELLRCLGLNPRYHTYQHKDVSSEKEIAEAVELALREYQRAVRSVLQQHEPREVVREGLKKLDAYLESARKLVPVGGNDAG